ncbi:hypothetical protein VNO77_27627 [Canavalia gladiata]|uniref:Uncharacterized protein n=1 Tax=Canavalia gladiata TaxID=3824 RepID=A0AAN9KUC6_CANGL
MAAIVRTKKWKIWCILNDTRLKVTLAIATSQGLTHQLSPSQPKEGDRIYRIKGSPTRLLPHSGVSHASVVVSMHLKPHHRHGLSPWKSKVDPKKKKGVPPLPARRLSRYLNTGPYDQNGARNNATQGLFFSLRKTSMCCEVKGGSSSGQWRFVLTGHHGQAESLVSGSTLMPKVVSQRAQT